MASILVLSGPNLQLLGVREPEVYGVLTLAQIHERLRALAALVGSSCECRQSNHEGDLVTWIGEAKLHGFQGVLVNPGALTHTSMALLDATRSAAVPVIEVHLSNPEAREAYRRRSWVARAAKGKVAGFGARSYELALLALLGELGTPLEYTSPAR